MKHRLFWVRFFLAASILTAAMIFSFSAQKGTDSQSMSDTVTDQVVRIIRPDYAQLSSEKRLSLYEMLSTIIRKSAHFCEFALLGFNLMGFFRLWRWERPPRPSALLAWFTATLYAGSDELHQLFVNERAAAVLDVCLDSAGALTGILIAAALLAIVLRRRRSDVSAS